VGILGYKILLNFDIIMNMAKTKQNPVEEAKQEIANAARIAIQTISDATNQATKVSNSGVSKDHDLMIKLEVKMDGIKDDIRELKDGTKSQLNDHEIRLNSLETKNTRTTVLLSIVIALLSVLTSVLIYHVVK
jgi:hypothetical protein